MRFEKWQALGNDYLIVEADQLPWDLTAERVRGLCHANYGPGGDGVLLLSPGHDGHLATLKIFNPDGSEAELSGNGAREAAMYLRARGWTDKDEFTIATAAGTVAPRILDGRNCTMALGTATTASADWPDGPDDGFGKLQLAGSERVFRFVHVGNPQVTIEFQTVEEVDSLDLASIGPAIETDSRFPNRSNVSFWAREGEGIRARIFERGVGETMSSGTGSSGAAVAAHLGGAGDSVDVRLDGGSLNVTIGEGLSLDLTGWAIPVYAGVLAPETVEELS